MATLKACDNCGKTADTITDKDDIEFQWFSISTFDRLLDYEVCSVRCGGEIFPGAIKARMDELAVELDNYEVPAPTS